MGSYCTQLHLLRLYSLPFVLLFKPEVRVPDSWIEATPSLYKKCKSIKGTAGHRRLCLIVQRKCDEKSIDSKVAFLQGSAPPLLPTRVRDPGPADELRIPPLFYLVRVWRR
jgi:hypothetical protein